MPKAYTAVRGRLLTELSEPMVGSSLLSIPIDVGPTAGSIQKPNHRIESPYLDTTLFTTWPSAPATDCTKIFVTVSHIVVRIRRSVKVSLASSSRRIVDDETGSTSLLGVISRTSRHDHVALDPFRVRV